MLNTLLILFCSFLTCLSSQPDMSTEKEGTKDLDLPIAIPTTGNSWIINDTEENHRVITDQGIRHWSNVKHVIRTYFRTSATGNLDVGLNINASYGHSKIKVTVGEVTKEIEITDTGSGKMAIGKFQVLSPGYQYVELQGIEKNADYFPDIDDIYIGGAATKGEVIYVKDDFYWGRRGPSVHLTYETPKDRDMLWFYNEIRVPEKEDVIGSYFMANGFSEGYFGMQVNSETERRILFSVWSPYKTQDPNEIPEDYKIILLGKGKGVTTGEFGNEGSGGQSYKIFDWKVGTTYKFLLKGVPSKNNSTDYTAYFFAPEENKWQLIASFRRPHTHTYLTRPHSFLENFRTETGFISRKADYTNQWVRDAEGNWHELTKAKFTADATARKGNRLDYAGGATGATFFMQNCGFFSKNTPIDSFHKRKANGIPPDIDFSNLEIPTGKK